MNRDRKSRKKRASDPDDYFQDLPEDPQQIVFSNALEFGIIFFGIAYSLFCLGGYLLDLAHLRLSVVNLFFFSLALVLIIVYFGYKKIKIERNVGALLLGILVFLVVFMISWNASPSFLPISDSVDYPHHYILVEYFSVHEAFPQMDSGLGEMNQYPFGPSLFTSFISRIISLPIMNAMGLLVAIVSGLIAAGVYLISRELLKKCKIERDLSDVASLVGSFMVFTLPIYFLEQYSHNFYYSMVFGELLVLLSLLALMKSESGNTLWLAIFFFVNVGIIYTYTLFIVIPFLAFLIFAVLNRDKIPCFSDRKIVLGAISVFFLFAIFSIQRFSTGIGILQNEAGTVAFNIFNFNVLFIILVVSGLVLYLREGPAKLKRVFPVFLFVVIMEFFAFVVLNQFGKIALYYANKQFYVIILVASCLATLPIVFLARRFKNTRHQKYVAITIAGLIGLFSLYSLLVFPVPPAPIITNGDAIFMKNVETYFHDNNLSYDNLSISGGPFNRYFDALLLHMDRQRAGYYLTKETAFDDWSGDPNSSYVAARARIDVPAQKTFLFKDKKFEIVLNDGRMVLIKKLA
jgi:hypothetical protein